MYDKASDWIVNEWNDVFTKNEKINALSFHTNRIDNNWLYLMMWCETKQNEDKLLREFKKKKPKIRLYERELCCEWVKYVMNGILSMVLKSEA